MNANALNFLSLLLVCALSCASEPAASESDVDAGPGVAASASSVDSGAHASPAPAPGPARDAATDSRPAQGSAAGAAAINSQPAVAGGGAASAPSSAGTKADPPKQTAAAGTSAPAANSGPKAGAGGSSPFEWGAVINTPKTPSTPSTPVSSEIDTVMMDIKYELGPSGNLDPNPTPIILFKDGWACRDINFVVQSLGAAAHRAMYPESWVPWQLVDSKVALQAAMGWKKLDVQLKYPPLPASLTFDQTYKRTYGAAVGAAGSQSAALGQQTVHLTSDRTVEWGTESVSPPDHRGTYQLDGYTITFTWDSGSTTTTSFVWSDADPEIIFIDGGGFVVRN